MIDDVPPALARILEGELVPGERLVWHAVPTATRHLQFWLCCILAGVTVLGAIAMWLIMHHLASRLDPLNVISLRPIEILLVILSILAALIPLVVWRSFRHTVYAITDRRAILIHAPFYRRIQSFSGEQLINVFRRENQHGRGDVIFHRNVGFIGLDDARAVERLLRQTYEAAHPR